jgi:hypothetical protein
MKRVFFKKFLILSFLSLTMGILINCAGSGIFSQGGPAFNTIVKEEVPLNESGPLQTTPASVVLKAGTKVRVISNGASYAYVETIQGEKGFVPINLLEVQK